MADPTSTSQSISSDDVHALQNEVTRLRSRIDLLLRLQHYTYEMAGEHNLDRLLQQFVDASIELVSAQGSSLLLLDDETGELVFVMTRGEKEDVLRNLRLRPGEGLVGWVVTTGVPAIVNNVAEDERFSPSVDKLTKLNTRSLAVVPLIVRDRTIGAIEVVNKQVYASHSEPTPDTHGFTDEDKELLLALASQAAIAIERTRLLKYMADEQRRLVAVQEEVRRKIARDLHDGPAQRLTAMSMNINVIQRMLKIIPERVPAELDELDELALRTSREIRTLLFELRPIVLQTQGLLPALEQYVEYLKRDGMNVTLIVERELHPYVSKTVSPDDVSAPRLIERMDHEAEATVFTIIQEAINNSKKHAHASHLTIELRRDGTRLLAIVSDNGVGFDMEKLAQTYDQRNSFGLLNMRERAELVGGQCEIYSQPDEGTTVEVHVPLLQPQHPSSSLFVSPS